MLRPTALSCDRLNVGESAYVAGLDAQENSVLLRLSALGIVPGARVRLLQKWPCVVLQCDETEIAMEEKIARKIHVLRIDDSAGEPERPTKSRPLPASGSET